MTIPHIRSTNATISSAAIGAMLTGIADNTALCASVLRECALSERVLTDDRFRVPAASFTALAKAIIRHTKDESLALLPRPIGAGAFALAGTLAVHSPTIGSALDRIVGFYSLLGCGVRFDLVRDGANAVLRLRADEGRLVRDDVIFEIYLMAFHRFAVWLAGHPLPLRAIRHGHMRAPTNACSRGSRSASG